ncbi:light-harvesting protein [Phaeovibrio sulfidiphilus]|uniref:Light-harvesting protein n=2 Tax=Phaeovibrio sulfidiphilus TaxID=1220600 RepID=A0A8J6YVS8_9PROT|nr:light-harvesting protein [Phaeovibrio sulfidiphilus]
MWRVWLIVNPAHALFFSSAVATLVAIVVHLHVFNSPFSETLLKPLVEGWTARGH